MPSAKSYGSFRDPSGFVFRRGGLLYRQVNSAYRKHYDQLMASGLCKALAEARMLIHHSEAEVAAEEPEVAYRIVRPELIKFISYPYEWSFSQLKDAALLTLAIQKKALAFGMSLKDASAYNIQFHRGQPILIDTLSFERYREGWPWVAYRQFCQHFLAPLALMAWRDIRAGQFSRNFIDGIPLDFASKLLPLRASFCTSLFIHIFLHAKSQKHFEGKSLSPRKAAVSRRSLFGLVENLERAVAGLTWRPSGTEWAEYYEMTNYSDAAMEQKKVILAEFLSNLKPAIIWDLGANTGVFSRIASVKGILSVAIDSDPAAVEKNYLETVRRKETHILPLLVDLANPSPAIGWGHSERMSLEERGPTDVVLALALLHHLAISNNLPFERIAEFFSRLSSALIVEFVPKQDSQVQKLLKTRDDIFADYTREAFEAAFRKYFTIREVRNIDGSQRMIYLMTKT
ncbi:MAG: SAM-dependent methyltransferase [Candidatus Sungbacteria bacterium]|nr:SAM-dependent methyltransferase [Candidatus Sungbacteria bacterium]